MPFAEIYRNGEPDFTSNSMGFFSTGAALVDLDRDGERDIVVSNGNDMSPQSVVIHRNQFDGQFWPRPDWYAEDLDYHGGLSVGDVNGDGWVDVAVTVMFGRDLMAEGGGVKIYLNRQGTLEARPSFRTPEGRGYLALDCALGDVDADGDLDLAVAVLDDGPGKVPIDEWNDPFFDGAPVHRPGSARIYLNRSGAFEPTPSWVSEEGVMAGDVLLTDVDQDGWMDLVAAGTRTQVFHGRPTGTDVVPFARTPGWASADAHAFSYSVDAGRIGPGASLSLAVSSGCLVPPCKSRFEVYRPAEGTAPTWSHPAELSSKLLLADLNGDEHLDMIAGQWGSEAEGAPLWIFSGSPSGLSAAPPFEFRTRTVQEGLAVADLRKFGLCERSYALTADAPRAVITLPERRIDALREVRRDGEIVPPTGYAWAPDDGWISVTPPLRSGERVEVHYVASSRLDVFLANYHNYAPWVGNMIFYSRLYTTCSTDVQSGAPRGQEGE